MSNKPLRCSKCGSTAFTLKAPGQMMCARCKADLENRQIEQRFGMQIGKGIKYDKKRTRKKRYYKEGDNPEERRG